MKLLNDMEKIGIFKYKHVMIDNDAESEPDEMMDETTRHKNDAVIGNTPMCNKGS